MYLQRLARWQCDCAVEPNPDGKLDERDDIFRTDVLRRIRIPEQRRIRFGIPHERLKRDQPLPVRRRERDERGGRARRTVDCEDPVVTCGSDKVLDVCALAFGHSSSWLLTIRLCLLCRARPSAWPSLVPAATATFALIIALLFA